MHMLIACVLCALMLTAHGKVILLRGGYLSTSSTTTKQNALQLQRFRSLTMTPIVQDSLASSFCLSAAFVWVQIWIDLAKRGVVESKLSRKIIHVSSAPLFMLFWPLYSDSSLANVFAGIVPLVQLARLVYSGLKKSMNPGGGLVGAISRSGDQKEALGGPAIYTAVLLLVTLFSFKVSAISCVTISQMAVGDGLADIVGRRWGTLKWGISPGKSYAGTLAFVLGAFASSVALCTYFVSQGFFQLDVVSSLPILLAISVVCAAVELIPYGDDNISVPLVAAVLTYLFLQT